MPFGYPVSLELGGKRAVVIGATAVRARKDEALRAAGAAVDVFANRAWRPEDLDGTFVCVASSDDPDERAAIARAARERGVLVNVVDDVSNCDFTMPAVVRRGDLSIAVATGGASPALARRLREELSERFGPEWSQILEVLREVREETLDSLPDLAERSRRWRVALDTVILDTGDAERLIRDGRREELKALLIARLSAREEVPA